MRCFSHTFQATQEIDDLIEQQAIQDSPHTLIQIFSGTTDATRLSPLLKKLSDTLPQAVIIGASTSGEIAEGRMQEGTILLSFACFEHTELIPLRAEGCDGTSAEAIASQLEDRTIKVAILFSEGIAGQPEHFIETISAIRPDLVIAGGAAGDNGEFKQSLLMTKEGFYTDGVVGVALKNPDLIVSTGSRLGYLPLGKRMRVTRADGPRLITLDHQPIQEVIGRYLGRHTLTNLPASIVQFPLIKEGTDTPVARAPVAALEDGSLLYAGNFTEGEQVRFGLADAEALLCLDQTLDKQPVEGAWIYSCMGRKAFLGHALEREFEQLAQGRPLSGFFTYGEFFHTKTQNQMLNLTTTLLTLSEGGTLPKKAISHTPSPFADSTLRTLSHLSNTITTELEEAVGFLEGYRLANDEISLISRTDTDGTITYVNDAFCAISGYSRGELIGHNHRIVRHPDTPVSLFEQMWHTIRSGAIWRGQLPSLSKEGRTYHVDMAIVPIKDAAGLIIEYIAVRHDVTQLLAQEKTIAQQSIDPLTGLPNRNAFFDQLQNTQEPIVALLNVDRFRDINSFYGFKAGDQLLRELADRLRVLAGDDFRLFRVGGDLFLLLAQSTPIATVETRVRQILDEVIASTFLEQSFGASIRLSAGIASGAWQALSRAETALNRAQESHRDLAIASAEDEHATEANLKMIGILRQAVAQPWWVVPYFQPIARSSDGAIIKYEALMRLRDNHGAIYAPFSFLDLAKHSRYYPSLTRAMIAGALEQFAGRSEGVTLNLAAEDIQNPQTMAFLRESIIGFDHPSRITLEITESEMIEDYESAIAVVDEMKQLGVKIAIDDFGSGYSNFAYLIRFQADFLKIDGSIVRQIVQNEDAYKTLCAIVDLAKRFEIETIAEFVSSEEIALKAKEAGVDYWQGYHIAQPAPLRNEEER